MKAPSTKLQHPEKHQAPNSEPNRAQSGEVFLELGIWNFSGAWMLVLGAFSIGGFSA